jgi:O-glycosyl hydrolase
MDKLVGRLIEELDRQHLRERTLLLFTGDNGTAPFGATLATVDGRHISGQKGTMLEGGSRVPLVVNWPGVTPAGRVNRDLTDFSDFFATIAQLAGAKLPRGVVLDSHSFAPQILGQKGSPREWVYVELRGESYVRGPRFKLTNDGKLFDMVEAPFKEIPVAESSVDPQAAAARKTLQAVLDQHKAAPWTPPRRQRDGLASIAAPQSEASTFRVHPETTFQKMAGFGAGFSGGPGCEGFAAIEKPEDRRRAYDLLYGQDGVRLNIARLTISPFAQSRAGGRGYDWAKDENTQAVWKCVQEVLKRTKPIVYAVPFSPPARWKDSGQLTRGGSLKREHYREYAEYLADFLEYYHKVLGVDVDVLSLQNEPGVAAPWMSCTWTGAELRDFLNILAPVVRGRGLKPQFMLSEGATWTGAWLHLVPTLEDPLARPLLNIIASHSYGARGDKARWEFAAASQRTGLPVWMSEMSLMQPPAPDDGGMDAALRVADYMNRDIIEGRASAWIYCFAIFTSKFPGSMGVLSPADGQGPLRGTLVVPKRFWAMANYSRFVRPGWKRMQIEGAGLANAGFVGPAGDRFAIVVLNPAATPQRAVYSFGSRAISAVEAFATTADLNLGRVSPSVVQMHRFDATLLPASVTTFVGRMER